MIGIYVLKEDLKNQKTYIVDCLIKNEDNLITKFIAIKSAIDQSNSVIFWEENAKINLIEKIIYTIFKRQKINIIYYKKENFDQRLF